jgi:tetratricopeptide (TPR) repeat protein
MVESIPTENHMSQHEFEDVVEQSINCIDRIEDPETDFRSLIHTLYEFEAWWDTGFTNLRNIDVLVRRRFTYIFKLADHPEYEKLKDCFDVKERIQFVNKFPDREWNADKNPVAGYICTIDGGWGEEFVRNNKAFSLNENILCCDVNSPLWQTFVDNGKLKGKDAEPARTTDFIETVRMIVSEADKQGNRELLSLWYPIFAVSVLCVNDDPDGLITDGNVSTIRDIIIRNSAFDTETTYGLLRLPSNEDFNDGFKNYFGENGGNIGKEFFKWWYAPLKSHYESLENTSAYWGKLAHDKILNAINIRKNLMQKISDPEIQKSLMENAAKLHEEALSDIKRGISIDDKIPSLWLNGGIALMETGRQEEALAFFTKALDLDKGNDIIYGYRGKVFQDLGRNDQAKMDYLKALEINPENEFAKYYLKTV